MDVDDGSGAGAGGGGVEGASGAVEGGEAVTEEDSSVGEDLGEHRGSRDKINVRVLDYHKTDEDFTYTVETAGGGERGKSLQLQRTYNDLRWLYRLLAHRVDIGGHILPPFPEVPAALSPHQESLGPPPSSMFGGYARLACLAMETFLQTLADHPFFSMHHEVHTCLTSEIVPVHDAIGAPSLWSSLTSAYSNHQLSSIQDTDDEFVEMWSKLNEKMPVLEECSQDFTQLVASWQKVACAEMRVCECVKEEEEWEVGRNNNCATSLQSLSNILDEVQKYNHSASTDAQNTVGFTFDLQHRYSKQAKDMLYRRLEKVHVLINASRQLDKAKPEKKEAAEHVRAAAMTDYNDITITAKTEMDERYTMKCTAAVRDSLVNIAESQLTHSRCLLAQLTSLRSQINTS